MKSALFGAALVLASTPAFAWDAHTEGPDVFGVTKVLAGQTGSVSDLVMHCSSSGTLLVAMLFPKKKFDKVALTPAEFYIATGSDTPLKLPASRRDWNNDYFGIVLSNDDADLSPVIRIIRDAKGAIKVGADIGGNQISDEFSSAGSTAAMRKVIKDCKMKVD